MELLQKRKYRKTKIIVFFVANFSFSLLYGQEDINYLTQLGLNKANLLYERGRVDTALLMLTRLTAEKQFKSSSKILKPEIYRLKALCAHFLKEDSLSIVFIDNMLVYSPFYKAREADPLEFLLKIKTANPLPRLMFGLKLGTNATAARVNKRYSIFNYSNDKEIRISENYSLEAGVDMGVFFQVYFTTYLSLSAGADFSRLSFSYNSLNDLKLAGPQSYAYKMRYDYLDIPLCLAVHPVARFPFKPYVQGGFFYRYLSSAGKQIGGTDFPFTINSNRLGFGLILGAGVSYDYKRTRFSLNYSFKYGRTLANNPNNRYVKTDISGVFILENYDVDNDIYLNTSSITFSVVYLSKFKVFRKKINPLKFLK